MPEKKRLLAVSWEMPPMYGPRATQVAWSLGELAVRGWQVTAVCLNPRPGGPHWPDMSPPEPIAGVELIRVPSIEDSLPFRAISRVLPILRRFPDEKRFWAARAVRAAREIHDRAPFAGVITFAQPWSDHLVGLRLRRERRLPWVAHFSDPWVDSPYARGLRWQAVSRAMEHEVVSQADMLVFVTEETADLVMRRYPAEWRRKVSIVPHGFHSRTAEPPAGRRSADGPRRRPLGLVYTGRFYAGVRTPSAFLRALAALNRRSPLAEALQVLFMGPFVEDFRREAVVLGLDGLVRFEARRPRHEAARAAAGADALLVIDAPGDGVSVFLPSKLVEYLAFRKPILGLTPPGSASAKLLARLGCPVAPPDDERAIADALGSLLDRWQRGELCVPPAFDAVRSEFDIRCTTARLDDVLTHAFGLAA